MRELSLERLRQVLDYDPKAGIFRWRVRPYHNSRRRAGDPAGRMMASGHRYIGIDDQSYQASRLAWFYTYGEWPKARLRFRNGNVSDIAVSNLEQCATVDGDFDFSTKEGRNAYNRAHRVEFPDHYKDVDLRKNFGITLARYREMHKAQGGRCAICGDPESELCRGKRRHLSVDHHHGSGGVRGLLCMSCNKAIGLLRERQDLFEKAAAYLRRNQLNST